MTSASNNPKTWSLKLLEKLSEKHPVNATLIRHVFPSIPYRGSDETTALSQALTIYGASLVEEKLTDVVNEKYFQGLTFEAWEDIY